MSNIQKKNNLSLFSLSMLIVFMTSDRNQITTCHRHLHTDMNQFGNTVDSL